MRQTATPSLTAGHHSCGVAARLLALLLVATYDAGKSMIRPVDGYPMIIEVSESETRCISLNIPENDDAHLVFSAIPSPTSDGEEEETPEWITNFNAVEGYIFGQTLGLTQQRRKAAHALPRAFPEPPAESVKKSMDGFLATLDGERRAGCQFKLSNPKSSTTRTMESFWFTPVVVNYVRKVVRANQGEREASPLEGLEVCFVNSNEDYPVQIVMDTVLTSEDPRAGADDDAGAEGGGFQGSHLTPLAEQLEESMDAARSVIKEMNYLERREARMRTTADSINSRVRFFSYVSVGILLVVTYVQVTYLKRYFRKKKLL